jgi:hypothetical protein
MTQRVYAKQTLKSFGLKECQLVTTSMVDKPKLRKDTQEEYAYPRLY